MIIITRASVEAFDIISADTVEGVCTITVRGDASGVSNSYNKIIVTNGRITSTLDPNSRPGGDGVYIYNDVNVTTNDDGEDITIFTLDANVADNTTRLSAGTGRLVCYSDDSNSEVLVSNDGFITFTPHSLNTSLYILKKRGTRISIISLLTDRVVIGGEYTDFADTFDSNGIDHLANNIFSLFATPEAP